MVMAAPHVVIFPFPIPGHYLPISTFAHALASWRCTSSSSDADTDAVRVTLILTEAVAQKWHLIHQQGDGNDKVQQLVKTVAVSDGLPLEFDRSSNYTTFFSSVHLMGPSVRSCVEELLVSSGPISCLISDPYFPWMEDVAQRFSLPLFLFITDSAAVVSALLHTPRLLSDGLIGTAGSLGKADVVVDYIPGMPALPAKLLPFPPPEIELLFSLRAGAGILMQRAAGLLINTFCELEEEALGFAKRYLSKPVLAVGPCVPNFMVNCGSDAAVARRVSGGAPGQEEEELMQWLDAHPPASVMYVSFGSLAVLPDEQTHEVWEGLRASKQPFLWATRSKLAKDLAAAGEVEEGWRVVEWAPQQRVLSHPSVGGFMTHCGWNAALEGVAAGVPMLCFPQFLDQHLTSALIVGEWRTGLQLAAPPERAAVERQVRLILQAGEVGKSLRQRTSELRKAAVAALRSSPPVGSSAQSLHSLIKLLQSVSSISS